jgi:hypothetical protein
MRLFLHSEFPIPHFLGLGTWKLGHGGLRAFSGHCFAFFSAFFWILAVREII